MPVAAPMIAPVAAPNPPPARAPFSRVLSGCEQLASGIRVANDTVIRQRKILFMAIPPVSRFTMTSKGRARHSEGPCGVKEPSQGETCHTCPAYRLVLKMRTKPRKNSQEYEQGSDSLEIVCLLPWHDPCPLEKTGLVKEGTCDRVFYDAAHKAG